MVTNKDLWDEREVDILMNRAAYGIRLSDSMTNEQLTTPVSSHHLPLRLVVVAVVVIVK